MNINKLKMDKKKWKPLLFMIGLLVKKTDKNLKINKSIAVAPPRAQNIQR